MGSSSSRPTARFARTTRSERRPRARTGLTGGGTSPRLLFRRFSRRSEYINYVRMQAPTSSRCRKCSLLAVCGGGMPLYRWSSDRGYDNPSVYCHDHAIFIRHAVARLGELGLGDSLAVHVLLLSMFPDLDSIEYDTRPFEHFTGYGMQPDAGQEWLHWLETDAPWELTTTNFYEQYEFSLLHFPRSRRPTPCESGNVDGTSVLYGSALPAAVFRACGRYCAQARPGPDDPHSQRLHRGRRKPSTSSAPQSRVEVRARRVLDALRWAGAGDGQQGPGAKTRIRAGVRHLSSVVSRRQHRAWRRTVHGCLLVPCGCQTAR